MTAPVLPAEMNASDLPAFWRPRPTAMDEFFLERTAWRGLSPMPTTSGASTMTRRLEGAMFWRLISASMTAVWPTSWTVTSSGRLWSAKAAPATGVTGASSPPIASIATRKAFIRP